MGKRLAKQSAEFTAKTLEEALKQASQELGLPVEALEYEVVRDTTRTILGLVRRGEVTVRVMWEAAAAEQPSPSTEHVLSALAMEEGEEAEEIPALAKGTVPQNPPELEETAIEVISTLLDKMGIYAAVEVVDSGGKVDPQTNEVSPLCLNIIGDDLGMLIGRRGETLRNLQFIVRLILSRRLGVWPNLVLDVEGYKAKRVQALQALARRMADQVRQTRQMVVLEPMPAHERRIVHLALRDDPDVYTESTGEGENRKVQIIPKSA